MTDLLHVLAVTQGAPENTEQKQKKKKKKEAGRVRPLQNPPDSCVLMHMGSLCALQIKVTLELFVLRQLSGT